MNTTGKVKSRKNKKIASAKTVSLRWVLCAVIFVFALVTASCQSFFGTYPFGLAAVSAVSGVLGGASAVLGSAIGSLFSSAEYGGYLALLSGLLFAARLTVSWWLKGSDRHERRKRPAEPRLLSAGTGQQTYSHEPLLKTLGAKENRTIPDTGQMVRRHPFSEEEEAPPRTWSRRFDFNGLADRLRYADGTLLHENIAVRMAMGALAVMLMGVLSAAEGGFSYYSLFGAVFSVLVSPIIVYMIYGATEHYMRSSGIREAGIYMMAAIFTYALSAISPRGFNFGYSFAFAASLAAATSYGSVRGLVTGLLCGILMEPMYAPLFAISAGVCGLICGFSSQLAVMSALTSGIAWGIYVSGIGALGAIVPPLALSAAVLLPLYHLDMVRLPEHLFGLGKNLKEAERGTLAEVMQRNTVGHLSGLSDSMKAVSKVVGNLAGRLSKPTRPELREITEEAFERYCTRCAMHPACYGVGYEKTMALMGRITEELYATGTASAAVIPRDYAKKCCQMGRILDEVNYQSSRRYAALAAEDKLSVVAGDYEMMGELLAESIACDKNEMKEDDELTAKLSRLLAYHDFRVGRVTAYGVRHKRIFVHDIDLCGMRLGAEDIRRLFERLCGFPMSEPEFEIDDHVVSMRIRSMSRYAAESGRASLAASDIARCGVGDAEEDGGQGTISVGTMPGRTMSVEEVVVGREIEDKNKKTVSDTVISDTGEGEITEEAITVEVTDEPPSGSGEPREPSGDVISSFEADGQYYMLISDGMGSGREAALTSSMAAMFMERMLTAGASMETSLKMLNKLLRAGERECSTTIDLAKIDLGTGEAKFIKSGAAPSFVIRDGSIYRLQSKTVPIGIIRALDAEMIRFDVMEGDVIVMLSDGVARSFEECPWLLDMLASDGEILKGDPTRAAEKIVRTAMERGSVDDITAGVIRISKERHHSAA